MAAPRRPKPPIAPGQVWRDRYHDSRPKERGTGRDLTKRTVRVDGPSCKGKWLCEVLTDNYGKPLARPRVTLITSKSLHAGYELMPANPAPATSSDRDPK